MFLYCIEFFIYFIYFQNGLIRHRGTKRCLEISSDGSQLLMLPCSNSKSQVWRWKRNKSSKLSDSNADEDLQADGKIFELAKLNNPVVTTKMRIIQELAADDY